MGFSFKKTSTYAPGKGCNTVNLNGGGTFRMIQVNPAAGGGGILGSLTNPYTLLTDGTPLLFDIDSTVVGEYRDFDNSSTPHYAKYAKFTAPLIVGDEELRIKLGVQTDGVDNLDSYAYVFTLAGATPGSPGTWTLIDFDDDGGSGGYSTFENSLIILTPAMITAGVDYLVEATTYSTSDTSPVKLIAEIYAPVVTGITLNDGVVSTAVDSGGTYPYVVGDSVTLDTTDPLKNVSINIPPGTFISTMPLNLSTVPFPAPAFAVYPSDTSTYTTTTQQGVSFDLNVSFPPSGVTIKTSTVQRSKIYPFFSGAIEPITLATTNVDTTYTITDPSSAVVATGNMPYDIRNLTGAGLHIVTASGDIIFKLNMSVDQSISGISGRVLHLNAAGGTDITTVGTDVISWTDISSAGNNATSVLESGGAYPQYTTAFGGGVQFTSANLTGMTTNAIPATGNGERSMFMVVTVDPAVNQGARIMQYGGAVVGGTSGLSQYLNTTAIEHVGYLGGSIFYTKQLATNKPGVAGLTLTTGGTPGPSTMRVWDGTTYATIFEEKTDVLLNTAGTYGIQLGRPIPGSTLYEATYANVIIHEVIAYNRALTNVEAAIVMNYLKKRWDTVPY